MPVINENYIQEIRNAVHNCYQCQGLDQTGALCIYQKEIGLDYSYPKKSPIKILFIAESPPRPGNGFFYDDQHYPNHLFRNRLFSIINQAGLGPINSVDQFTGKGYYLADAINCRWDKKKRRNFPIAVFNNCSRFLALQIRLFRPLFIVAMGRTAQKSIRLEQVQDAIREVNIPQGHIIHMSFPVVASNQTDKDRVNSLRPITEYCQSMRTRPR